MKSRDDGLAAWGKAKAFEKARKLEIGENETYRMKRSTLLILRGG